jgi:hypothetical protein
MQKFAKSVSGWLYLDGVRGGDSKFSIYKVYLYNTLLFRVGIHREVRTL